MQDQSTDLGDQQDKSAENIENNNLNEKDDLENKPSEEEQSASEGEEGQEKAGELPDDFKGRLAREKKAHQRKEAQMQSQISQLTQTVQALLNSNGSTPQPQPQNGNGGEDETNEVRKQVRAELAQLFEMSNQQKTEATIKSKVADVYKKMETADEIYPDFDEIRTDPTLIFPPNLFQQVAVSSANPIDVIYYLGKNRDRLNDLLNTSPALQSGEIAKISAELLAKGNSKVKEVSKAPPPANALSNNPTANSGRIRDNASVDELRKLFR